MTESPSPASQPDLQRSGSTPPSGHRRFPCAQCGGQLNYAPGTTHQRCPYCSHENDIPASGESIEELDLLAALGQAEAAAPHADIHTVRCTACNAEVQPAPTVVSFNCPYCDASIVNVAGSRSLIKPRSLLPFGIPRRKAEDELVEWFRSRWFAPSDLRRFARTQGRFQGVYVPYWTYDCRATSDYRGARGEYYYVTVGTGNNRRRERRTRWYPASGRVHNTFDDLLVLASHSLPHTTAQKLEPWDLPALVPYADEYLSGFMAESYTVELREGFEAAKGMMEPQIHDSIRRHIGGDTQRIDAVSSRYSDITFKHILLPVWMLSYSYRGRLFRVLVNARTGEIQGDRPYSPWKIAGAVFAGLIVLALVVWFMASRN